VLNACRLINNLLEGSWFHCTASAAQNIVLLVYVCAPCDYAVGAHYQAVNEMAAIRQTAHSANKAGTSELGMAHTDTQKDNATRMFSDSGVWKI
jgi:hypothetical protein